MKTLVEAVNEALHQELDRDPSVLVMGEDIDGGALTDQALRSAVDAAPDGIVVVDESGTIVFVNPMVETMFGCTREELLGAPIESLVPTSAREDRFIRSFSHG